jgi:hypothetical protein
LFVDFDYRGIAGGVTETKALMVPRHPGTGSAQAAQVEKISLCRLNMLFTILKFVPAQVAQVKPRSIYIENISFFFNFSPQY